MDSACSRRAAEEKGGWSQMHRSNEELYNMYLSLIIIRIIVSRQIRRGYLVRM